MVAEKCPDCGSMKTVRHSSDAGLKPNWLHCNGCALCAPYEVPKRGSRGRSDGDDPSPDSEQDGAKNAESPKDDIAAKTDSNK